MAQRSTRNVEKPMDISVERRSGRVYVHCTGSLDATGGERLEEALDPVVESVEDWGQTHLLLNLSGVTYLSSAGIRALLTLQKAISEKAGKFGARSMPAFRVVSPSDEVLHVLEVVRLAEQFLEPSEAVPAETAAAEVDSSYLKLLKTIRQAFPVPVSDPIHDAYFVQSIAEGLSRLDDMKSEKPYLGEHRPTDYCRARKARIPEETAKLEQTLADLAGYLDGLTIWGHPLTQENVIPPASIPSIVGQVFASIYNPNIIWDEYSHRLAEAEMEVASMCSTLIGYNSEQSVGLFTWGGTGTIFYGMKLGLEKAQPGAFANGVREDSKVVCSEASHYAKLNALGWLGLGTKNLVTVPTDGDNSMALIELEDTLRALLKEGKRIACIIATMGTTDAFGIDNLEFIVRLRDTLSEEFALDYTPHVHADAVIGWAWAVFNDYNFDGNPLGFPQATLRSLWDTRAQIKALGLADSVGIDFHKTGYTPYTSSLFLCRDKRDLDLITRDRALMPYLFQFGHYHPGVFTMETSRAGCSVLSALANLTFFGRRGYQTLLGHIVTMAEDLRMRLSRCPNACVVNDYNYGPVTLFRVYPRGVLAKSTYLREANDPQAKEELLASNEYNRKIFDVLYRQSEAGWGPALSLTEHYRTSASGAPILALKSFVMSPFVDGEAMEKLMECLELAVQEVG